MINSFSGEYEFLSNFYPSKIQPDGPMSYPTVEHYFQGCKAEAIDDFYPIFAAKTPGEAKRLGKRVRLRKDWEMVKDDVMLNGLRAKFAIPELREKLLATGDEELVEGNTWGDTYWGVCNGVGQNKLGKLLMQVREEIKNADLYSR